MKKFLQCLLAGLSILCSSLNAQDAQLEDKVLEAISTLDQTQCPSGLLYERVPEYYPFSYYRGKYLSDSTSLLISRFSMIQSMLRIMDINQNSDLPDMDSLLKLAHTFQSSDTIRLGILHYSYHRLDTAAISKNLIIYQNENFYDVDGRTESPYLADTVFAFSAFNHIAHNLVQKFTLSSNLVQTNIAYSGIEIDFDDGLGYRTINANDIIQITYSDYGIRWIKCRLILTNGEYFVSQTMLDITPSIGGLNYDIVADDSISLSGVKLYWWYNKNCEDHKIRKPLIIIEGFDPLNSLGSAIVFKEYGLGKGLLNDKYGDQNKLLAEYLHDDDYDVFFIDYKQGHIRIQDNANYVIKAMEWINNRKHKDGSYEKNIVIGASMGGLVGYYALRTMENQGREHETEFYLTFDSPLKGANIPIGMQAFIQELGDYKLVGKKLKEIGEQNIYLSNGNGLQKGSFALNSPAAKQMLYYHYDSPSWSDCGGIDGDCTESFAAFLGSEHDKFFDELDALGKLNVPHYGISNGSILRKEQQFGIGAKLADAFLTTDELLDQAGFNDFWSDATELLLGVIFKTGFFSKHIIHGLAETGRHRVYYGGFGTIIIYIPIVKIIERHVKDSKPYDSAPGGMRNFEKGLKWNYESFCFIPTISSLKLNTVDPYYNNIQNVDDVESTIASGNSSLTYYSGSTDQKPFYGLGNLFWNEDHVSLNKRLAEYLRLLVGFKTIHVDNPLDSRTFNFGDQVVTRDDLLNNRKTRIRNVINYDLDIKYSGKLWINRYYRIGYTDDNANTLNCNNCSYELNLIQDCIDTTVVLVKDGGRIEIGDKTNTNNTAKLYVNDSTRLIIGNEGVVNLEEESYIYVNSGGVMTIQSGGRLIAAHNSKLIVRKGGILRINNNGILNLTDNAEVIVEWGGKIIVDGGAILRMQDGNLDNDGRCRIIVNYKGVFRYNGGWKHDGNGYIQFDQQSVLDIDVWDNFAIKGYKKSIRFIRLNTNCNLNILCQNISIRRGKIDYEERSEIHVESNLTLDSLRLQGTIDFAVAQNDAIAFRTKGGVSNSVSINFCDFNNIEKGLFSEEWAKMGLQNLVVKRTMFTSVLYPLDVDGCRKIVMDSVYFLDGYFSTLLYVNRADLNRVVANNMSKAFVLVGNKYFVVKNSSFTQCTTGISASGSTNVFAYQSNFSNNNQGIYLIGNGTSGLVELGCCNFNNNNYCIKGEDILLNLSPLSNNSGMGAIGKNKFVRTNLSQLFFDVAYVYRPIDEVDASYNYWGGSFPPPNSYSIYKGIIPVPLLYIPYLTNTMSIVCHEEGHIGSNDNCPVLDSLSGSTISFIRQSAMDNFHLGYTELTESQMQSISDYQNDYYQSSSIACRFNFDYARVFTLTDVPTSNIGQPIITSIIKINNIDGIQVSPNPANEIINLNSILEIEKVEVINSSGIKIFQSKFSGKDVRIACRDWPVGIYCLRVSQNGQANPLINVIVKE